MDGRQTLGTLGRKNLSAADQSPGAAVSWTHSLNRTPSFGRWWWTTIKHHSWRYNWLFFYWISLFDSLTHSVIFLSVLICRGDLWFMIRPRSGDKPSLSSDSTAVWEKKLPDWFPHLLPNQFDLYNNVILNNLQYLYFCCCWWTGEEEKKQSKLATRKTPNRFPFNQSPDDKIIIKIDQIN